ncbi:MAG: hypothetical protein ABIP51_01100 [Bacteroidia bacterium]
MLSENVKKFLKDNGRIEQATSARKVSTWAKKLGKNYLNGTAIGKHYNTLILDLTYQGSQIYINIDGDITFSGEPVTSFKDFKRIFEEEIKN